MAGPTTVGAAICWLAHQHPTALHKTVVGKEKLLWQQLEMKTKMTSWKDCRGNKPLFVFALKGTCAIQDLSNVSFFS